MKINNPKKTDKIIKNQKCKATKIIVAFLVLCTMFCIPAQAQDIQLDENSAADFIKELAADLETAVGDEDSVTSIREKWEMRNLVGKTKSQALGMLIADVRAVVDDPTIANGLRIKWIAKLKPTPPAPINPSASEDLIKIGKPALSDADMDKVMEWIAVKTAAQKLPFCWKQTTTRGVGVPLSSSCAAGLEKDGQLCYQKCNQGYAGAGPVCWGKCPSGYTDIGAFCQKPEAEGRGVGYALWDKDKCERENPQGCEQNAALFYPKCKAGFRAVGSNICSPECPKGYVDTGTGCTKPSYGRNAGETLACPSGTIQDGLLCYPQCGKDYKGAGPVCWQNCPSQHPFDCTAACTTNQAQCALKVFDMVKSTAFAAVSLASLGGGAGGAGGAKSAQLMTSLGKMGTALNKVKTAYRTAKGNVTTIVGGAQNLAKIKTAVKAGKILYKVGSPIGKEIDLYAREFADNFEDYTSPEITRQIDENFEPEVAYQIKREWGVRHLTLNMEANNFTTLKDLVSLASVVDPTGLNSVINAFLHPECKDDTPFPEVKPIQ